MYVTRSIKLIWACVMIGIVYPTILNAKKRITIDQKRAFPSMDSFYAQDVNRDLKLSIEEMIGLYLVDPPRRHLSEYTHLSSKHLHFHLWYPIANKSIQTLWSTAATWLILGRTQYATGAQGLFSELPSIQRITLSFHEVQRSKKNKRRKARQVDVIHPYMQVSIIRSDFEKLDVDLIKRCAINFDCDRRVRAMFTLVKINAKYLKSKSLN